MTHYPDPKDRFQVEADRNAQLNDVTDRQLADLLLEEVWGPMSSLTAAATIAGQAYDRLKRSTAGPLALRVHGLNCAKVVHCPDRGYLHSADEDGLYIDRDNVVHCGRCHEAL